MMSRFLLLTCFFLIVASQSTCPTAPSSPQDRRLDKSRLTVGEFNAEWLFYEQYRDCPGTGCPWSDQQMALKHLSNIASVIKQLNVDILLLVEIEDCNVLTMLLDQIGDPSYRHYLLKGTDTATGQNVAIITRIDPSVNLARSSARVEYPVAGSKCGGKVVGTASVSKHLYTTFNIDGLDKPLVLIGAHFLAFPLESERCSQREAQATVIQQIAQTEARAKDYHYIIAGDLNDYDGSFLDTAGDVPISRVLQILKSDGANKTVMTNAMGTLDRSERWSSWYDQNNNCAITPNERTLIDHILLSSSLMPRFINAAIPHDVFGPICDILYSDHWPTLVTLRT